MQLGVYSCYRVLLLSYFLRVRSGVGNITVLVAAKGHSEGIVENQKFCQFGIQCNSTATGGKRFLFVAPAIIGIGLRNGLGNHRNCGAVVTENRLKGNDPLAQLAEQLPFKQWVWSSNLQRVTMTRKYELCTS